MHSTSDYVFTAIGAVVMALIIALTFGFIGAAIAVWLWKLIIIPVFNAPEISYWQMYGLLFLVRIILPTSTKTVEKN